MKQRVWLWNPWQADIDFYHNKPIDVPAGWRVLGMADKNIILVSAVDSEPEHRDFNYALQGIGEKP